MPAPEIRVIGAGPAGSATAIRLANTGRRVQLFEKAAFPRPKLCGGFISSEALADLTELDVLSRVQRAGAHTVNRIVVASSSGETVTGDLPAPGLSISRLALDAILFEQARSRGVQVMERTDGFSYPGEASWTIVATGKGSPHPNPLPRGEGVVFNNFLSPLGRGSKGEGYYGIQAIFENVAGVSDQVELDFVPGAYVGLVRQHSQVNVCLLAHRDCFGESGPNLDTLLKSLMTQNSILQAHLAAAKRFAPWQAVGPVRMGLRQLSAPRRLFVGDAACVVDPFAGEGIAMGLQASALVVQAFAQTERPTEEAYEAAWRQKFNSALRVDHVLRRMMSTPFLQELTVRGLKLFPRSLTHVAQRTRPAAVAVS